MTAQILFIFGASILGLLGLIHLLFTFNSSKFYPVESAATEAMKSTSLVLTKETTVWRAWVGFNASHSLGLLSFAAIYIPLALLHFPFIANNLWFALLPSVFASVYVVLAKNYWFTIPFVGMLMSTGCFITAFILLHLT